MVPSQKIALTSFVSVGVTVVAMLTTQYMTGLNIPRPFWILAIGCSSLMSGIVAIIFIRHNADLLRLHRELERAYTALQKTASTDHLTNVMNRASFMEMLKAQTYDKNSWLMLLDVDHFKRVNDLYGHAAGDETLRNIAAILRSSLRSGDIVGRIGGEEFALYLPVASRDTAMGIAHRIRNTVASTPTTIPVHGDINVTVSIGITLYESDRSTSENMRRADTAMYAAKNGGRNRIKSAA